MSVKATGTRRNVKFALQRFEAFVESRYGGRSSEEIIEELNLLKDHERESALFDLLQNCVNYMDSEGITSGTNQELLFNYTKILVLSRFENAC